MKGIIYCRVSSQEQVDEGNSLKTQERLCREFAFRNKIEVEKVFIEEGESAKTINRPKLQEMMKYCKLQQGKIDSIIIYRIDRLSRESYDYAWLKAFFSSCKVKLLSMSEQLEDNPVGRFMENTLAGIAQLDNEIRSERSKNGMIDALKDGRHIFKVPYGYDRIGGRGNATIIPNQILAPKIKEIFSLVINGYKSLEELRQRAKELGLNKENGKPLSKSHFYKMLRNPAYKGYIDVPSMGIYQKGTYEYIVEPEVFDSVQQILTSKSKKLPVYKKINPDFPLKGTIKHTCGYYMTANWAKVNYAHYRCTHCRKVNLSKIIVETDFSKYLKQLNLNEKIVNVIQLAVKLNWEQQQEEYTKNILDLESKVQKNKDEQKIVVDKNIAGVFSNSVTKTRLNDLENEIGELNLELMRYSKPEEEEKELLDYSLQFLKNISGNWENTDVNIQNKLQKFLFPNGLVYEDGKFTTDVKPLTILLNEELSSNNSTNLTSRRIELRLPD